MKNPSSPSTCFLALGANLEHATNHLHLAIGELLSHDNINPIATGPIIRTPALDNLGPDYQNTVVAITTTLSPLSLLDWIQQIERQHGRTRKTGHWGPRVLDIDIISYGKLTLTHPRLTLPHPQYLNRPFVVEPICAMLKTHKTLHFPFSLELVSA